MTDKVAKLCTGVIYQVYLRSFYDGNGDGIGDLVGLREKLPAIADLGCDAIWINPCYPSPQHDHGYDISDYRSINPEYGTFADFLQLIEQAHAYDLQVLMDIVPNHCSVEHAWFQAALHSAPNSPARNRFIFRSGRGENGELPPNNWQSVFGGSAWSRITEPSGEAGQWYLHLFDSSQPDFNWRNPEVAQEFLSILNFWYDCGVDGFRIDVAHGNFKSADLGDDTSPDFPYSYNWRMWNQPEVHDIYRSWRACGDERGGKYLVGEVWLPAGVAKGEYVRPDELHQAFAFDLLVQPWKASEMRAAIDFALAECAGNNFPAWALANHDVHRAVTRYGQNQVADNPSAAAMIAAGRNFAQTDIELGTRRALAAIALVLALPGSTFIYQGEELGLPEYLDIPDAARQDPIWLRTQGVDKGRDGCRIPLPWDAEKQNFGFSTAEKHKLWLPQPEWFAKYARSRQEKLSDSFLAKYRNLLKLRAEIFHPNANLEWLSDKDVSNVLAFRAGCGACVVNLAAQEFSVPSSWNLTNLAFNTAGGCQAKIVPANSTSWYTCSNSAQ